MDKIKTVALVGGVIIIWSAGCFVAWKGGELLGKGISGVCLKGTEKLIKALS